MTLLDTFFAKGLLIGFSIAAPVGPIGVLCIRRTLVGGRLSGVVSGLGAATADGVYGAIAAFGLTMISSLLIGSQFWLRLIGGFFLLSLGGKFLFSKPLKVSIEKSARGRRLLADYTSTLFLTITNPMTILSFAAIFAGLGLANSERAHGSAAAMVAGVAAGSALWWIVLSGGIGYLRSGLTSFSLRVINHVSAGIIIALAIAALASALAM